MAEESTERLIATGWDDVDKAVASGGAWVKFEDKQVKLLNICGQPQAIEKSFKGEEPKKRVVVEVYEVGEGRKKWELAPATWRELVEERRDCKEPFTEAVIAVKRMGTGTATTYRMKYQRQLTAPEIADRGGVAESRSNPNDSIPF